LRRLKKELLGLLREGRLTEKRKGEIKKGRFPTRHRFSVPNLGEKGRLREFVAIEFSRGNVGGGLEEGV